MTPKWFPQPHRLTARLAAGISLLVGIREWIVDWQAMAAKHDATRKPVMPDQSKLPKEDVNALVAYRRTLE